MLPFSSSSYTSATHVPGLLLVILVSLVFPRAPLFLVGGKQAQDPPGPLDTIVSPVEGSSIKGRSPR